MLPPEFKLPQDFDLQREQALSDTAGTANCAAAMAAIPSSAGIMSACQRVFDMNLSRRSRIGHFRKLADTLAAGVAPYSVCAAGCSACCHIAVVLSREEAEHIGHEIGRKISIVASVAPKSEDDTRKTRDHLVQQYFGVPCAFLHNRQCSIYEFRPLACRLHFNLGHSPIMCSPAVDPDDSRVPGIDFQTFWMAALLSFGGTGEFGDIRDYFKQK